MATLNNQTIEKNFSWNALDLFHKCAPFLYRIVSYYQRFWYLLLPGYCCRFKATRPLYHIAVSFEPIIRGSFYPLCDSSPTPVEGPLVTAFRFFARLNHDIKSSWINGEVFVRKRACLMDRLGCFFRAWIRRRRFASSRFPWCCATWPVTWIAFRWRRAWAPAGRASRRGPPYSASLRRSSGGSPCTCLPWKTSHLCWESCFPFYGCQALPPTR